MVRFLTALLGVLGVSLLCLPFAAAAENYQPRASLIQASESTVQGSVTGNLERILAAAFPQNNSRHVAERSSGGKSTRKATEMRHVPLVKASAGPEAQPSQQRVYAGTMSSSLGDVLFKRIPDIGMEKDQRNDVSRKPPLVFRPPSLVNRKQMQSLLMPGDYLRSVGKYPTSRESEFDRLEIEVSYSRFHLKVLGQSPSGRKDVLYQCNVALGAPEFDTPKGSYFVTHIYDRDPWWIPPANRAWAAGQSPSRKVYGGYMAPLLKKRQIRSRKKVTEGSEDKIEGQVRLEDYGYRFHGTNAPRSIGHRASHGCVRMLPKDVEQVVALIKKHVGTLDRLASVNGSFVLLKAPIRLNIVN